jgi:hypothetical protein
MYLLTEFWRITNTIHPLAPAFPHPVLKPFDLSLSVYTPPVTRKIAPSKIAHLFASNSGGKPFIASSQNLLVTSPLLPPPHLGILRIKVNPFSPESH